MSPNKKCFLLLVLHFQGRYFINLGQNKEGVIFVFADPVCFETK